MASVRDVEYQAGGLVMRGRLAIPDGDGPFPAVLIAHEANGLDEFQAGRALTFCELGYAALALDYHGGGRLFDDQGQMMGQLEALGADPDEIRSRARAALDVLLAEPAVDTSRVAAVGYCFGETVVMELARTGVDLKAVVGFHPGLNLLRPGDSRYIRGKVLMCVGADDPIVPLEQRVAFEEEMRSAGVDWRMTVYGGAQHSFTHPRAGVSPMPGLKFDKLATERSWRAMLDLFAELF
ncbi:MAG: dienelactone hydrolase family protein [Acidimicrobiales bacterium]